MRARTVMDSALTGRLFSDISAVAILVDLVLWAMVSLGLVALLTRTSAIHSR